MSLLKHQDEIALGDTTAEGEELLEVLKVALAVNLGSGEFCDVLQQCATKLESELEHLHSALKSLDYLPAAGNIELAEVRGLALKAKTLFSTEPDELIVAGALSEKAQSVQKRTSETISLLPKDHELQPPLRKFRALVGSLETSIREASAEN